MNTGRKIYPFLKQINSTTGIPTGLRKPNVVGDPDYVAPVADYDKCPIVAWVPIVPFCITIPQCGKPYTYDKGNDVCSWVEGRVAVAPTISEDSVSLTGSPDWNTLGAKIYQTGYPINGIGTVQATLTANPLWLNGGNYIDGRFNEVAVAGMPKPLINQWLGFTAKITATSPKVIYIGASANDYFRIKVNGIIVVDKTESIDNLDYWHIYPVSINAGDNYIEIAGARSGLTTTTFNIAGFGTEIYDNTSAEIIAATVESDLNILFSSKKRAGGIFDFGYEYGYNCPDGWSLAFDGGAYVCIRNTMIAPTLTNTGMKGYAQRKRITNGVEDGYVEDNLNGTGIGPYFAPVQDLAACPI